MRIIHYNEINTESDNLPLYVIHTVPLDSTYMQSSFNEANLNMHTVFIDLPGHGKSEDVDPGDLDFEYMASKINGVRKKLNHERIIILGHGIGGFVSSKFLINYPDHTAGLILINSAGNSKYRDQMAWNIRDQYSDTVKQALDQYKGKTDEKSIKARFTQALSTYFSPPDHDRAKELMDSAERIGTDSYVHLSRNVIPTFKVRAGLRKSSVPTLIIVGKDDVWPNKASSLLKNDIPHSKFLEFKSGHFPMLTDPNEFWEQIYQFVQSVKTN